MTQGGEPMRTEVVVVSGLSGAGKSTAIHALEDLGFYCCDNLPTRFAPELVEQCESSGIARIALGFDVRLGEFLTDVDRVIDALDANGKRELHLLFIDASDESLIRRFSETRRPHPLAPEGNVLLGITRERERLAPLRARASRILDTTRFSVHDLRRALVAQFSSATSGRQGRMVTRLVSFGFKYGSPVDADLLLDVRFLPNPFFVPAMKHRPGTEADVAAFVLDSEEGRGLVERLVSLLAYTHPLYEREGKAYLTVGIGCTGGRHRSVAVAEELARRLAEAGVADVHVAHRDVGRGDASAARASDHDAQSALAHRYQEPPTIPPQWPQNPR